MTRWTQADIEAVRAKLLKPVPKQQPRASKYGNKPTAGFASKREAKRATELKLMEQAGEISDLKFQVPFVLIPAQFVDGKCVERSAKYVCDFQYVRDGKTITEDCKGMRTNTYILKRKMLRYLLGIEVVET